MVCEHLQRLEQDLKQAGFKETYRGQPWSTNCREWIYFDCLLDLVALRARLRLPEIVIDHVHRGTHDGSEAGFVCTCRWDAIMGAHAEYVAELTTFT